MKFLKSLLLMVLMLSSVACAKVEKFTEKVQYPATFLIVSDIEGGAIGSCTGFNYKRVDDGYLIITAGHCLSNLPKDGHIGVFTDETMTTGWRADLVALGKESKGQDIAVVHIKMDLFFPTIDLGVDPIDPIEQNATAVGYPEAAIKSVFRGNMASVIRRKGKMEDDGPNPADWTGDLLFTFPGFAEGSSGSPVVCDDQQAICGLAIGLAGQMQVHVAAVPVSRMKTFLKEKGL